jgi:Acyl-CoA dehydrogenase, C-terminal domain
MDGRLMDDSERALLADTLGQLATAHDGAELDRALGDFGFRDLLGQSPREAVSALFAAMGRAGSAAAALQDVLARPLAGALAADRHAGAGATVSVVLPPVGGALAGEINAGSVAVRGILLGHRPGAVAFLAPASSAGQVTWAWLPATALAIRPAAGLDPDLPIAEVTGTAAADIATTGPAAAATWQAVLAAGRRALGYQMLGAASAMIDLAAEHARTRVQFGQPVGSFQAVRHRLADALVAREGAAAALELSWDADDEALAAMLAKSLAGRAARIAATHCQQVLAGLGFTADHPFHRYLARALVLDRLLGSAAELPAQIGARLAAAGGVPRLAEL